MAEIRVRLFKVTASLARCENMPSIFFDDWNLPKSVSNKTWRKFYRAFLKAETQCKDNAFELRQIINMVGRLE